MSLLFRHFISALAVIISRSILVQAQSVPVEKEQQIWEQPAQGRAIMAKTTHIFEGELIRASYYFTADSTRVYRTAVIRLTHLTKGVLAPGTVQIVYKGPRVGGFSKDPYTGELLIILPVETGHERLDIQGMTLPNNKPILFFCQQMQVGSIPQPVRLATSNTPIFEVLGAAFDLFHDNSIISDVGGRFENFPALYRHLEDTYPLR